MNDKQKEDILRTLRLIEGAVADILFEVGFIKDTLDDEKDSEAEDPDIPL